MIAVLSTEIISMICKVEESAHVKKQAIVIFSIPIFHTFRPHTLPSKRVKMRWAFLLHTKNNLKHSQDCVGLAFPFCPWAGVGPQGSCNWWVHCSHPWTAQDPDANRWYGSVVLDISGLSTPRYPWLGHPSSWPLWSSSLWHRPNWVSWFEQCSSFEMWSFQYWRPCADQDQHHDQRLYHQEPCYFWGISVWKSQQQITNG